MAGIGKGRKQQRGSPHAPAFRVRHSISVAVFHVRYFQGLSPLPSLGCSTAPSYVPSSPARTPQFPFLVFEQARYS